jgi:hypothetical protein
MVSVCPGLSAALCEGQTTPKRDTKEGKNNGISKQQQPQQQQQRQPWQQRKTATQQLIKQNVEFPHRAA